MKYENNLEEDLQISLSKSISYPDFSESIFFEEHLLLGKRLQAKCINNYLKNVTTYFKEIFNEIGCALKIYYVHSKNYATDKTNYSQSINDEMNSKEWWKF